MRKFAREMIEKYPSIARINEAIAGPRRLGSSGTVEGYIKGIIKFLDFLNIKDPEKALSSILLLQEQKLWIEEK